MKNENTNPTWVYLLLALLLVGPAVLVSRVGQAQADSRTFTETGKTVKGRFLTYWNEHGALAQQGYPISNEMQEKSDTDGKTYTVQYFERAVFELHPENKAPNDVLLSLLGVFRYREKYPNGAPNQQPSTAPSSVLFNETGKRVGGLFLQYWSTHGGLPQQGFPISDEFREKSDLDGKTYTVQYFERAVFELHPENKAPYDVLLSQLGTFRYRAKYQSPPTATAVVAPVSTATPAPRTATPQPTQASGNVQEVKITLVEWALQPSEAQVNGGRVRWVVTNGGRSTHNLTVISPSGSEVGRTRDFEPNESPQTFEATLAPGTYQMLCSIPGHAQAGQRGTLVVK
jgi:hypothetical protein